MATKKDKENNGPSTQRTGTVGVNAIGVNHGMTRQEAVKPTPQQAMAQMSQTTMPQPAQVGPQQVPTQTAVNPQQNPVVQPTQTAPTTNSVQPVQQQQFTMPQQITMPNGQVINMQPTAEQLQQAQANTQKQAQTDNDEYIKTLKEYLDSKYQSPEDKAAQEKREARQRKWAAISEGIANVFNVGGSIAGARPAQWKSGVGELYANQEAEADKRRAEYREALKDMMAYKTAIRNGDIARARAIEEQRRNNFYEYKMLHDQENKAAEQELKKQKQEADERRKDQEAKNKQRKADDDHRKAEQQLGGTYKPSGNTKSSSSKGGGGRGRSGGSRATGAAAAKSAKAAAKRRAKAATQGTKYGKK